MTTKRKSKTAQPEPAPSTPNSSWMFELDAVETWAFWDDIFSKVECEKIIEIGNERIVKPAQVGVASSQVVNHEIRDSKVSWLFPDDDTRWIFQRVAAVVHSLNQQFFNFDVFGLVEGFQFTKYEAPSGYYGLHTDRGQGIPPRKLSVSIQLNDNADFEGGELRLHHEKNPAVPPMKQGKLAIFPSYTLHEVTPVTKGTRYSLVCWITGKPFK
jgi:PKHD-type hydroxylase